MQAYTRVSMGYRACLLSRLVLCYSSTSQEMRDEDEVLTVSLGMTSLLQKTRDTEGYSAKKLHGKLWY